MSTTTNKRRKHYPGEFLNTRSDDETEMAYGHLASMDDVDYPAEIYERQLCHQFTIRGLSLEQSKEWGEKLFSVSLKHGHARIVPIESDDGSSCSIFFSLPGRGAMPVTIFTFLKKKSEDFDFEVETTCTACHGRGRIEPKVYHENMFHADNCEPCSGHGYFLSDSCKTCSLSMPVDCRECSCEKLPFKHGMVFKCNLFLVGCTPEEFRALNDTVRCSLSECAHHPLGMASNKNAGQECKECKENRVTSKNGMKSLFVAKLNKN